MIDFEKQKQIETEYFAGKSRRRKELYHALEDFLWGLSGHKDPVKEFKYPDMTEKERTQVFKDFSTIRKDKSFDMENSCRSMLESKVAYGWCQDETGIELIKKDKSYLYKYLIVYGFDTVAKWAQELIDTVDHVAKAVYEDSEGCVYNSIVYKSQLEVI